MKNFYSDWRPVIAAYVVASLLLALGFVTGAIWPLGVAIVGFALWDLLWVTSDAPDRTAQEAIDSATRARTYMSYFVAVYGAALAFFLLRLGESQQRDLILLARNAGVPLPLILLPFVLQAISMLFLPIRLGEATLKGATGVGLATKTSTASNLAVLVLTVWVEKVSTFCFVYVVVLIGKVVAG